MERKGFATRFLGPVGALLAWMGTTYLVHDLAYLTGQGLLYRTLCHVFGPLFFAGLVFGPLYVYPRTYFLGAGGAERIIASLLLPVAWMVKEVMVLAEVYSWGEAAYFFINPIHFLLLSGLVAQMGLCEILCRRRRKKALAESARFPTTAVLAFLLGLGSVALAFAWDFGVHHFYLFQEGYKAIWGYGL